MEAEPPPLPLGSPGATLPRRTPYSDPPGTASGAALPLDSRPRCGRRVPVGPARVPAAPALAGVMGAAGSSPLVRLRLRLPALLRPGLGLAALGLAAAALGAVAWSRARPRRRRRRRRRLQQVGTVSQLWIYPVKSCKGVPVSEAECTALGLRRGHLRDR